MERLWAPWRMAYVKKAARREYEGCIFCEALKKSDEEALIVYRGRLSYIIMNTYPYNPGHLMVVPNRHVASLEDLGREELLELMLLVNASLKGLREAVSPHGFNIGVNLGQVAGAGIEDHVHIHIVPRWSGDTNFMPVIGNTKVIPQALQETYKVIKDPIARHASGLLGRQA